MNIKQKKEKSMADSPNWMDKFQNKIPIEKLRERLEDYRGYVRDMEDLPYKNRLELELNNYGSLNEILTELLHENGGYIGYYRDLKLDDRAIRLAHDFGYGEEKNPFLNETPPEGWNEDHHCEVIFFYELCQDLEERVRNAYIFLKHARKLPSDVIPVWELEEALVQSESEANFENRNKTDGECTMHITMDKKIVRVIYNALRAKDVDWLADKNLDFKSFMNILTLPPSGKKIKLRQLNQIHFITRTYFFPPEDGKKTRRMTPEEWNLIKHLFDSEDGDMSRVDKANKKPQGYENLCRHINSAGIKR